MSLVTADLSFISLRLLFPRLPAFTHGHCVLLIKPQFEAGRAAVGKKGVVRDAKVHERVITELCRAAELSGCAVRGLSVSPITGQNGNIEYLLYLGLDGAPSVSWTEQIRPLVRDAWKALR